MEREAKPFEEPPPDGLRTYFAEELERQPVVPLAWDVEDFIPSRAVTGLFGDGGTGKDLILLQLAAVRACGGGRWLGKEVKAGRVIYCNVEDNDEELNRRRAAIAEHYGLCFEDHPKQLMIVPMAGKDTVLAAFNYKTGVVTPTALYASLRDCIASFKPALVIVGNRVNIFGVNQNDDAQARQCMQLLSALAIDFQTTVVMPGHVSLSGMSSGSGTSGTVQWSNACRSRLYLSRIAVDDDDKEELDPDVRQLEVKKANWGPTNQKIDLRWSRGVFVPVSSADADDANDTTWKFGDVAALLHAESEFLRMLDLTSPVYPVSAAPRAHNNAPKIFADDERCKLKGRVGKAKLKAAMERLLGKGTIVVQDYGRPSRPNSRIVRAP